MADSQDFVMNKSSFKTQYVTSEQYELLKMLFMEQSWSYYNNNNCADENTKTNNESMLPTSFACTQFYTQIDSRPPNSNNPPLKIIQIQKSTISLCLSATNYSIQLVSDSGIINAVMKPQSHGKPCSMLLTAPS